METIKISYLKYNIFLEEKTQIKAVFYVQYDSLTIWYKQYQIKEIHVVTKWESILVLSTLVSFTELYKNYQTFNIVTN